MLRPERKFEWFEGIVRIVLVWTTEGQHNFVHDNIVEFCNFCTGNNIARKEKKKQKMLDTNGCILKYLTGLYACSRCSSAVDQRC